MGTLFYRMGGVLILFTMFLLQACDCDPEEPKKKKRDAGSIDARVTITYADLDERQSLVVLGDAVATDYGVPYAATFGALLMENNDDTYPEFLGNDLATLRPGSERLNYAVQQARIEDVINNQLPNVPNDATVVVVALGINDYLDALGSDATAGAAAAASFGANLDLLLDGLQYSAKFTELPHIYVFNIMDATDGVGETEYIYGDEWPDCIAVLNAFNAEVNRSIVAHGAHLIDVHQSFLGHGSQHATPTNPYYNGQDPSNWYQADYLQPNRRGHSEIRRQLLTIFAP